MADEPARPLTLDEALAIMDRHDKEEGWTVGKGLKKGFSAAKDLVTDAYKDYDRKKRKKAFDEEQRLLHPKPKAKSRQQQMLDRIDD